MSSYIYKNIYQYKRIYSSNQNEFIVENGNDDDDDEIQCEATKKSGHNESYFLIKKITIFIVCYRKT